MHTLLEDRPSRTGSRSRRFVVRAPLVAMKSLAARRLVTLEKGTVGKIIESYGELGRPGTLIMAEIENDHFLIWMRDIAERAELLPSAVTIAELI